MVTKRLLLIFLCLLSVTAFATDYLVTSTDDSGTGTLREALLLIESGDTITFDDTLSGTIQLASALPAITVVTTITGPTTGSVTIDAASLYSIFDVTGYAFINNLTLLNNNPLTAGSAFLVNNDTTLVLDNVSIPHCGSGCEAPVHVLGSGVLITNNVTFSSPGGAGVDVLFEDGSGAIFACDLSTQPQVWIDSVGSVIYKEGNGVMQFNASSSVNINLIADEGTLIFSDTCAAPIIALPNGVFEGTPTAYYIANNGTVETGTDFGVVTNTTDYYQQTGGTLITKIDASGSQDIVQAPGIGYLSGDLIIPLAPGTYNASTSYALLICDSGINSSFNNVYFDIPGIGLQSLSNASLNYLSNSVELEITSTFVVDPAIESHLKKPNLGKTQQVSPVSQLFQEVMEHPQIPRVGVNDLLHSYSKTLREDSEKAFLN